MLGQAKKNRNKKVTLPLFLSLHPSIDMHTLSPLCLRRHHRALHWELAHLPSLERRSLTSLTAELPPHLPRSLTS